MTYERLLETRLVRIMLQILVIILLQISSKSYQNALIIPKFHSLCSKLFSLYNFLNFCNQNIQQ